jgi:hypothetical protein
VYLVELHIHHKIHTLLISALEEEKHLIHAVVTLLQ